GAAMIRRAALLALTSIACTASAPPTRAGGPRLLYVPSVPFFPAGAEDAAGSAASLASILGFYGITREPIGIAADLATGAGGPLALGVALYPRRFGLRPTFGRGGLGSLGALVVAGGPVLVLLGAGASARYALVVGLDVNRRLLILYEGNRRDLPMPLVEFEADWSRAGRWMTVVARPRRRVEKPPLEEARL